MQMDWVVWVVIAVGCGIGEMLTNGFFLAPFAFGGALAAITAGATSSEAASLVVFVVSSLMVLLFVRPIARRHMQSGPVIQTGSAALVGKRAVVVERIVNNEGVGCVRIDGEVWTARAFDEEEVIEPGTPVHVMAIKGATALVAE
jgi:membrane protein implicated in regulation of membrane protease activity